MATLDARVWQTRFTELRTSVLSAFPNVQRQEVEAAGGDFDALVQTIQRRSGMSATEVHERLAEIAADDDQTDDGGRRRASLEELRIGFGFEESERPRILELLRKLDRQLQRLPAQAVDLELTVKDRDTPAQKVTLEAWLPNMPRVVVTSREHALRDALMEVREDLWRQLKETLDRRRG
jgi:hypothetical protein